MKRCVLWKGAIQSKGYGMRTINYKPTLVHRLEYQNAHPKENIKGKLILHKCDVRNCIEPTHLFSGTAKDNTVDMFRKNRWKKPEYHFGSDHHNSKFSEKQRSQIKEAYRIRKRGDVLRMCKKYGTTKNTIRAIGSKEN